MKISIVIALVLQCTCSLALNDVSRERFAADLIEIVGPHCLQQNVVLSPSSIQAILALAYLGSEGATSEELIKKLHLEAYPSKEAVAKDYGEFINLLTKDGGKVQWANRIYLDNKYSVSPKFNEYAIQHFGSGVGNVNFPNHVEAAAQINKWVEEHTHDKIKNLIKPGDFALSTAAALVSAVYFKADWQYKFKVENTENREFSLNEHTKISVPTMQSAPITIRYCVSDKLDLRAVELPYEGTDLKMLILLPNKIEGGVAYLQPKITLENLVELAQICKPESVVVNLPKFRIETEADFKKHLTDMGFKNIFTPLADFTSMVSQGVPIWITAIKQKVFIRVDEDGSEAAAATFVTGTYDSSPDFQKEPFEFFVDRPFAFAIMNEHALYFVGHVIKPEFA